MSIPTSVLSFTERDFHGRSFRKYTLEDSRGPRIYRNNLGWEIRHVRIALRRGIVWRYDLYSPDGEFISTEPTFHAATRAFSEVYNHARS